MFKLRRSALRLPDPDARGLIGAIVKPGPAAPLFEGVPEDQESVDPSLRRHLAVFRVASPQDPDAWPDLEDRIRAANSGVLRVGPVARRGPKWVSLVGPRFVVQFPGGHGGPPIDALVRKIEEDPDWSDARVKMIRPLPYLRRSILFGVGQPRPLPPDSAGDVPLPRVIDICRRIMRGYGRAVVFAEPDFVNTLEFNFELPAGYDDQWNLEDLSVLEAWKLLEEHHGSGVRFGSSSVRVGLVDRRIQFDHVELSDRAFDSGYVADWVDEWNDAHATACASLVVASEEDGGDPEKKPIVGVAPGCRVLGVTVPSISYNSTLMDALWWAAGFNPDRTAMGGPAADVILCPWQKLYDDADRALAGIVAQGREGKGAVVVFSAGEPRYDDEELTVSMLPCVQAVGAYKNTGGVREIDEYSRRGDWISVTAPTNVRVCTINDGTDEDFGGTSAAAPHVAGVAALMLSANPALTAEMVRNILEATARRDVLTTRAGDSFRDSFGYGAVDAKSAVGKAAELDRFVSARVVAWSPDPPVTKSEFSVKISVRNDFDEQAPATRLKLELEDANGAVIDGADFAIEELAGHASSERTHAMNLSAGSYVLTLDPDVEGAVLSRDYAPLARSRWAFEVVEPPDDDTTLPD